MKEQRAAERETKLRRDQRRRSFFNHIRGEIGVESWGNTRGDTRGDTRDTRPAKAGAKAAKEVALRRRLAWAAGCCDQPKHSHGPGRNRPDGPSGRRGGQKAEGSIAAPSSSRANLANLKDVSGGVVRQLQLRHRSGGTRGLVSLDWQAEYLLATRRMDSDSVRSENSIF